MGGLFGYSSENSITSLKVPAQRKQEGGDRKKVNRIDAMIADSPNRQVCFFNTFVSYFNFKAV